MQIIVPLKREIDIYRSYLFTVNWMRKSPLSKKEMEVLAYFMLYNNKYKDLEDKIKKEILFSKTTRKEIQESLGMKAVVFDNYLKSLRDKGVIKENEIIKSLRVYPEQNSFTFSFNYELRQ